jgi:hypothetical protein
VKTILRLRFLLLAGFLFLAGCASLDPLSHDLASARKEISTWVPEGTTVQEAQRRMEQRDFTCQFRVEPTTQKKYLVCRVSGHGWVVKRHWVATFEIENDTVAGLQVGSDLVGP